MSQYEVYRGVSGFYDPAIPAFSLLKSVSRRREEKERLRRDAAPGNAGLQSGMCFAWERQLLCWHILKNKALTEDTEGTESLGTPKNQNLTDSSPAALAALRRRSQFATVPRLFGGLFCSFLRTHFSSIRSLY